MAGKLVQRAETNVETDSRIVSRFARIWLEQANRSGESASKPRMSSRGDREPVQGENKQGRTLFFVILGLIVFLFVVFLAFKPRGSQAGPPAQTTHSQ